MQSSSDFRRVGLRQCRFVASATRQMTLFDPRQDGWSANEPSILRLPDELLLEVFKILCGLDYKKCTHASAAAASRTCKRFHHLLLPLLYQNPYGEEFLALVPAGPKKQLLQRTYDARPSLQQFCKHISILMVEQISGYSARYRPYDLCLALQFLRPLTNLRTLRMSAIFALEEVWPIIRNAIRNMPFLETLDLINAGRCGPPLQEIYRNLDVPSLRSLHLSSALEEEIPDDDLDHSDVEVASILSEESRRMAPLISLHLHAPEYSSRELHELLTWPGALQHFTFSADVPAATNLGGYTIGVFHSALKAQMMSLRTISICWLKSPPGLIQLADYPELESFRVFYYNLRYTPEQAAYMLPGPKLRSLIFEFHYAWRIIDCYCRCVTDFRQNSIDWLVSFAEKAKNSSLTEIKILLVHVTYTSRTIGNLLESFVNTVMTRQLWNMVKQLKERIERCGISLCFEYGSKDIQSWKDIWRAVMESDSEDSDSDEETESKEDFN